jgi:hypothetical protein
MKTTHRLLLPLLAVAQAAGSAAASPRECRRFQGDRWDQRLSLAGCLRAPGTAYRVTDPEQVRGYVTYLASTVDRPVEIYRDAIARGPWEVRLLAAYELGQTYADLIVRVRAATPGLDRDREPLLVTWQRDAVAAFTTAWAIGEELPSGVACDDLVRNVIAGTREALDTIELR